MTRYPLGKTSATRAVTVVVKVVVRDVVPEPFKAMVVFEFARLASFPAAGSVPATLVTAELALDARDV
jgi:hypothetical protein